MQLIQTEQINPDVNTSLEIQAPQNIQTMFKNACYDCHSNQTKWPIYAKIAPFSWVISSRVSNGRKALDFTRWEEYTAEEKQKKLKAIYRTVYASMPLASYVQFHEEADLTKEERELIRKWTGVRRF
jgi:uncharacterized membrane protein